VDQKSKHCFPNRINKRAECVCNTCVTVYCSSQGLKQVNPTNHHKLECDHNRKHRMKFYG